MRSHSRSRALSLASVGLALAALVVLACTHASRPAGAEEPDSDPRAVKIADEVMKALGGKNRWDAQVGIRWAFEVSVNDTLRSSRLHAWNKHTGWHRVEGKTRAGQPFCFIDNINDDAGKAWMNGSAIEGDSLKKLLKRAKSIWINDTYWMLMPYKLRDPGVHLKYAGDTSYAGATYDKLALSFTNVGDTPGDRYWVFVNRANHRVDRWEMVLQGDQPPPVGWTWQGWEQHDGLWFPTAHKRDSTNTIVYTRAVETVAAFRANEFTAP